jgi:N-ethylmaleimide reductase
MISEGTQPSADGQGYLMTPGIHTAEQAAGWRRTADAVHAAGGHLFVQLMHVGRMAHPDNTPHGRQPVAPSAVRPEATMFTAGGPQPVPEPRALCTAEVRATVEDSAARPLAEDAGADGGSELPRNGYLIQPVLSDRRQHPAGRVRGSVEHRVRFAVEVAAAGRTGDRADAPAFRISPGNPLHDIVETDTRAHVRGADPPARRAGPRLPARAAPG